MRHRDEAVGDRPAVEALLQGFPHGVLDRPEKGDGHGPQFDVDVELNAGADRRRFEAQPDRGQERVGRLAQPLDGRAGADEPFDTDRRRLAKADCQAEVTGQRRLDDFLLDLAVQRDGDLLADAVLPDVDQRVLLGKLGKRDAEGPVLAGVTGNDDRLQGRRRELVLPGLPWRADRVIHLDLRQAPQLSDLPGRHAVPPDGLPVGEDADRGHLPLATAAEPDPVPHAYGAGKHADVGDLLTGRAALDLENPAGNRAATVPLGGRQEFGDAVHQRIHARSGERRPEKRRVHAAPPGLRREFSAQPPLRQARIAVHVRSQDLLVPLSQDFGQPGGVVSVAGCVRHEN